MVKAKGYLANAYVFRELGSSAGSQRVNFKTLSETASKCKFAVGFKFIKNLTLQISVFVQTLTANRARGLSTV